MGWGRDEESSPGAVSGREGGWTWLMKDAADGEWGQVSCRSLVGDLGEEDSCENLWLIRVGGRRSVKIWVGQREHYFDYLFIYWGWRG